MKYPEVDTAASYTYDGTHLYTGGTDPRHNRLPSTTYDSSGRLQTVTDAAGQTTSYAYDLDVRTTTITLSGRGQGHAGLRQLRQAAELHRSAAPHYYQRLRRQPQPDVGDRSAGPHHQLRLRCQRQPDGGDLSQDAHQRAPPAPQPTTLTASLPRPPTSWATRAASPTMRTSGPRWPATASGR
ncbi:MAG: hypothetical protein LAP87_16360 [Acidobacteriia bacterium]|nr:hypothetical protein [Terriglobia bacterium]